MSHVKTIFPTELQSLMAHLHRTFSNGSRKKKTIKNYTQGTDKNQNADIKFEFSACLRECVCTTYYSKFFGNRLNSGIELNMHEKRIRFQPIESMIRMEWNEINNKTWGSIHASTHIMWMLTKRICISMLYLISMGGGRW